MSLYKSYLLMAVWLLMLGCILFLFLFPAREEINQHFKAKKALLNRFLLTDYCLTTESRHTRHISMPELISPFQDLPGYHEHFPSSSFFPVERERFEKGF